MSKIKLAAVVGPTAGGKTDLAIGLANAFDGEVVSCEEHTVKPEPRIYEILLERYGLTPSETLFIDDRRSNLEAAAAFGIATFHFREPESSCTQLREMLLQKE